MSRIQALTFTIAAMAAALFLSSCGRPQEVRVRDAVVTLSPVDNNPSVLNFKILGGEQDVELVRVFSSSALRVEMHESKMDNATHMMSMEKLERVKIPAKDKVSFAEGGKHVMVWGINKVARRLGEMQFEFTLSNGERILADAKVQETDGSIPDERKDYMG